MNAKIVLSAHNSTRRRNSFARSYFFFIVTFIPDFRWIILVGKTSTEEEKTAPKKKFTSGWVTRAEKVNLASKYQNSARKWIHQGTQISRFGSGSSHFSSSCPALYCLLGRLLSVWAIGCFHAASLVQFVTPRLRLMIISYKKFAQKSKHRFNFPLICGAVKSSKDLIFLCQGARKILARVVYQ